MIRFYRWLLQLPKFRGKDRLVGWYRTAVFAPRNATLVHGLQFEPDAFEWSQSDLLRDGYSEPLTTECFSRLLRAGDTYVDVGAHVGFFCLLARHHVGRDGRLLAIEPQPYNCARFLRNCHANGFENISLCVAAAGESDGTIHLPAQPASDSARLSLAGAGVHEEKQRFEVPIRRLENLLAEHRIDNVRLLKIDVEGYELSVLQGLGSALGMIDHIIVELLDAGPAQSENTTQVLELLRSNGFQLRTISGESWDPAKELPENNLLAVRS